ncbi:CBS domain-containing protein [Actinacidiphila acidipaludis]|uniref:CBS domain-containing protein n=1 Tax=Actinacidiphila acidipaludis TaxID=2873382 RepID=A0ABS7PZS4_9ACTN|nr:CBS domain-containing protein [Streptomyces acidipaludis]MBY8876243.1 CBS domain-containing protein [Streptomyces acidipaludis]
MYASPRTVSDVMTQTVVALGQDATFKDIVGTMEQWKVSAMPVLEGEGRVVGVVSEADLLPKEEYRQSDPSRVDDIHRLAEMAKADAVTAGRLMSSPAVCVHADATLAQAARIMAQRKVKRLPVTDAEGKLAGIVSRCDLLKVFLRSDDEIAEEVRHDVVNALFPGEQAVTVDVSDGLVTLSGDVLEPGLIPVAGRLARTVEGVVDVHDDLTAAVTAS